MTLKIYKTKISGAGLRRVLSPKILLFAFFVAIAAGAVQAATFTVSLTGDAGDGTCDATCTLRDAILSANAQAGDDVIEFDAGAFAGQQTITLGGSQLAIANNGSLTINGTGARLLTVSGNNASRVFYIGGGANVTINGLTVTRGNGTGSAGWNTCGGGIFNDNASLTLNNSAVSGNSVPFGSNCNDGSGIMNWFGGGTLNVINSTVNNNTGAAGIVSYGGTANVVNSTVSNNTGNWSGGLDGTGPSARVNLTNVTVSGNTGNSGAGIRANGSTFNVRNSIIANSTGLDCNSGGTVNIQNSLVEDGSCGVTNGVNNNRTGDPQLAPLGYNGGATQTHALLAGSNAINTGNNCVTTLTCPSNNPPFALTTDQRGAARVGTVDIGAFELDADTDGDGVLDFTDNCPTTYNPEKITFASSRDGNREIYVMNSDGSNPINLTNHSAVDDSPSFSPDGSKIAFISLRDGGNREIYVMNSDGSNPINLTNHSAYDDEPSFSPDGSKIVFTTNRDGNTEIYVMNSDGSNPINLTNHSAFDGFPSFSPDGSKIAFASSRDGNYEIYVMNSDGSNQTRLTNHSALDFEPAFSPDGSKIVFTTNRDGNAEVYVMNADGSNQTRLSNNSAFNVNPSFSPDGSKISFTSTRDGNHEIYVINADGSNQTRLTNNSDVDRATSWSRQLDSDGDGTGDACELPDDTTPPVITPTVTGTLGNNDWYRSDVQVSWSVSDAESSVSNQTNCDMQTVSTDTAGITFTCQATSAGGTSSQSVTIKRDTTAPTINFASRTAPNASGWNKTNVAVQWTCADALSGAVGSSVSTILGAEGANQSAIGICTDNAGNTAQDTQSAINIDKTAPSITFDSRTPAANGSGWNNSDVTINWNCADTLSGAVNQAVTQTLGTEGASQSASGTCTDLAGNTVSDTQGGISIDKTAPTISFDSRTPAANTNGWNNSDVAVIWNCSDVLSGAVNSSVTQILTTEGANQSAAGTCVDLAGNQAQDSQGGINIDKTNPTITFDSRTAPNSAGWNNVNVTVNWNCSDLLSGAASLTVNQTLTTEGANLSAGGTCFDLAGNSASDTQTGIKIDKTAPSISFVNRTLPNAAGWNNTGVTVNWNCSDVLSGTVSSTVVQTLLSEGLNQSATGTCTDNAGNTVQNTQSGISIDTTAPTLAPVVTPNPILRGGSATASANAADALSGIAFQSCDAVNTSMFGSFSVNCTSTDNAGNTATVPASYRVIYNFTGFFQPIANLPMVNEVNAGQSIPIKFSLSGYQGMNIFAAGFPVSGMVGCSESEPGSTVEEIATPGSSGLSYSASSDQYNYVWKTNKAWKGTCRILVVRFIDGSEYYAKFRFK